MKEKILKYKRKKLRYFLFRVKTQHAGGQWAETPKGFNQILRYYEEAEFFTGWENFAITWDVGVEGQHDQVVFKKLVGVKPDPVHVKRADQVNLPKGMMELQSPKKKNWFDWFK